MGVLESLDALMLRLGAASANEVPVPTRNFWMVPRSAPLDPTQASRWAGTLASTLRVTAQNAQWHKSTKIMLVALGVAAHDEGLNALSKTLMPQMEQIYLKCFLGQGSANNQLSLPTDLWKSAAPLHAATAFFELSFEFYSLCGPSSTAMRFLTRYLPPIVFVNPLILAPPDEDSLAARSLAVAQDKLQKQAALLLVNVMDSEDNRARAVVATIEKRSESVLVVFTAARTLSLRLSIAFILKSACNILPSVSPFSKVVQSCLSKCKTWGLFAKMSLNDDESIRYFVEKSLGKSTGISVHHGCRVEVNGIVVDQKRIEFDQNLVSMWTSSACGSVAMGYYEMSGFSASKSSKLARFRFHDSLTSASPYDISVTFSSAKDFAVFLKLVSPKIPSTTSVPTAKMSVVNLCQRGETTRPRMKSNRRTSVDAPDFVKRATPASDVSDSLASDLSYLPNPAKRGLRRKSPAIAKKRAVNNDHDRNPDESNHGPRYSSPVQRQKDSPARDNITSRDLSEKQVGGAERSEQRVDSLPTRETIWTREKPAIDNAVALRDITNAQGTHAPAKEATRLLARENLGIARTDAPRNLTDEFHAESPELKRSANLRGSEDFMADEEYSVKGKPVSPSFDFARILEAARAKSERKISEEPLSPPTSGVSPSAVPQYDEEFIDSKPVTRPRSPRTYNIPSPVQLTELLPEPRQRERDFVDHYANTLKSIGGPQFASDRDQCLISVDSAFERDFKDNLSKVELCLNESVIRQSLLEQRNTTEVPVLDTKPLAKLFNQTLQEAEKARSTAANRISSSRSKSMFDQFSDEMAKSREEQLDQISSALDGAEKDIHKDNRADRLIDNLNSLLNTQ